MTFVLVSVVIEVATNKNEITRSQVWYARGAQQPFFFHTQSPLAIGFAVFCAHAVLLPIDGALATLHFTAPRASCTHGAASTQHARLDRLLLLGRGRTFTCL